MSARRSGWAVALAAPLLLGFSSASVFDLPAEQGGGGGYTFTGSPLSHGMDCATGHQGGAGEAAVSVSAAPPSLFEAGYEPGQVYRIRVRLEGERRGLDRQGACMQGLAGCNRNLMVAEVIGEGGAVLGSLSPSEDADTVVPIADGAAVAGNSLEAPAMCGDPGADPAACIDLEALAASGMAPEAIAATVNAAVKGRTEWAFDWTAPASGGDAARLYVAVVDGDGGTSTDPAYADYAGDAVGLWEAELRPAAGPRSGAAVAGIAALGLLIIALWRVAR